MGHSQRTVGVRLRGNAECVNGCALERVSAKVLAGTSRMDINCNEVVVRVLVGILTQTLFLRDVRSWLGFNPK
eukprot:3910127-Pyramimonas_sp.AAC.1